MTEMKRAGMMGRILSLIEVRCAAKKKTRARKGREFSYAGGGTYEPCGFKCPTAKKKTRAHKGHEFSYAGGGT